MKAFRFRLESVARVRDHQERAAAQQLAVAARNLRLARSECAEARAALHGLAVRQGRSDAATLHWVQSQSERMAATLRHREELVTAAEVAVRESRHAWVGAERRCTMLRRLEERQRGRWQVDADRAAANELDDMATVRFGTEIGLP